MLLQGYVPFPSNQNDMEIMVGDDGKSAHVNCGQRHQKNLSWQMNVAISAE